jgi:hypothetical protein
VCVDVSRVLCSCNDCVLLLAVAVTPTDCIPLNVCMLLVVLTTDGAVG